MVEDHATDADYRRHAQTTFAAACSAAGHLGGQPRGPQGQAIARSASEIYERYLKYLTGCADHVYRATPTYANSPVKAVAEGRFHMADGQIRDGGDATEFRDMQAITTSPTISSGCSRMHRGGDCAFCARDDMTLEQAQLAPRSTWPSTNWACDRA